MAEYKIGDILKEFLKKRHLDQRIHSLQIEDHWQKVMGITIAKYTSRIQLSQHTVFVYTDVAPLKQELNFQKNLNF